MQGLTEPARLELRLKSCPFGQQRGGRAGCLRVGQYRVHQNHCHQKGLASMQAT
jgi:hypothetical protein